MNLDDLEQRVLAQARGELTLTPAQRGQHEARLLGALGPRTAAGRAGALGRGFGLPGVVLGLIVGAGFGFAAGHAAAPASAPLPATVSSAVAAVPAHEDHPPPDTTAPALRAAPSASIAPANHESAKAERRPPAPRAASPRHAPQPTSSLAAELALLQRARSALSRDNPRLALGIVAELDERFPDGLLKEERSATRLLGSCALSEPSDTKSLLRTFVERYPESVYRARVEAACAARNVATPLTGSPPPQHQGDEKEAER